MSLSQLVELLKCPKTNQDLYFDSVQLTTKKGEKQEAYPIINGIPWVIPNPLHSMVDWTIKLNHFQQVLNHEIANLQNAIPRASGLTLQRIKTLIEHKKIFLQQIVELVAPITQAKVASKPIYDALSDRAPNTQNLLSYEANLYRDWVWGDKENELNRQLVEDILDKDSCDKLLVIGAGSGRLSYDLHQSLSPSLTISNDINPLLTFAAQAILFGEGLSICEFPLHPKDLSSVAVNHQINGAQADDNLHLLFSDAIKPAVKPGAMDTVITPWVIDIQPFALERFLRAINQYLPVGGQWVNFGSLVFQQNRDSLCYTEQEIKAVAARAGFSIEVMQTKEIPYLKSPYNAGYRMETVYAWRAKKIDQVKLSQDNQVLPDWILDIKKPIPKTQNIVKSHQAQTIYAELTGMVNGQRSIEQIAKRFAKDNNVDNEEMLKLAKDFFQRLV